MNELRGEIRHEDFETLARLGRALWSDPGRSGGAAMEAFSAASLLELTPDRLMERTTRAILDRAMRDTSAASVARLISQPFYRLFVEERFVLVALHLGNWSYERISRILNDQPSQIEKLAWQARLHLASLMSASGSAAFAVYPSGSSLKSSNCPEYDPSSPWTQRFLDDEIKSGQDVLFLQNHLMACTSCRDALNRCRDLYYSIDGVIQRALGGPDPLARDLAQVWKSVCSIKRPTELTFREVLGVFLRRWDARLGIVLILALWLMAHYR